jgi:hypothetical protein
VANRFPSQASALNAEVLDLPFMHILHFLYSLLFCRSCTFCISTQRERSNQGRVGSLTDHSQHSLTSVG